jgi:cell division protein FtsL
MEPDVSSLCRDATPALFSETLLLHYAWRLFLPHARSEVETKQKMKQQNSLVVVHVAAAEKVLYLALWAVNLRISACMTTTATL